MAPVVAHLDTLVVGAGSAGAVLAAELSADPQRRVGVMEAGPVPTVGFRPELLDPRRIPGIVESSETIGYETTLSPGRRHVVRRGRGLGGSSTVNGGYFVRARKSDFDHWARIGGSRWSWDSVLPLLCELESDLDYGPSPDHGDSGPIPVGRAATDTPVAGALMQAAIALGYPVEEDKNAVGEPGVGPVPSNSVGGVRWNTGLTHLLPALSRPNLSVLGRTAVAAVLITAGRVRGVITSTGSVVEAGEVVLCAGAFGTAELLLRSGIGPARDLEAIGVPVVCDLPVGTGFGDHPQLVVQWMPRWAPVKQGDGGWLAGALHTHDDIEILASHAPLAALAGQVGVEEGPLPILITDLAVRSTGTLRLRSADPAVPSEICYGYLESAVDRRRLADGWRLAMELLGDSAFRSIGAGEPAGVRPREPGIDRLREQVGTAVHACGTAPMGTVTDGAGRVLGIDGLRVADTALLPTAPVRGPANVATLIGRLIAELIRMGAT